MIFPLVPVDGDLWPTTAKAALVEQSALPEPYRRLLVHHHHMTVTVEGYYQSPVDVGVLTSHREGELYSRRIVLTLQGSQQIVQFGVVRIDLRCCTPEVRDAILAEKTPLGRVLIENNVLLNIEPTGFVSVEPDAHLARWMQLKSSRTLYGRTGVIFFDNRPAIGVLEILAPVPDLA